VSFSSGAVQRITISIHRVWPGIEKERVERASLSFYSHYSNSCLDQINFRKKRVPNSNCECLVSPQ